MEEKGYGLLEIKRLNRVRIKKVIYKYAPITRIQIAEALGLTLPTITTNVASMLSDGLLKEAPLSDETPVNPQSGRKPSVLSFKADAAYAVGAELGPYCTTVCATDLLGKIVFQREYPIAPQEYDRMLPELAGEIRDIASHLPQHKLLGAGVGLPGFIESEKGVIRSNSRQSWNGKNLMEDLRRELGLGVTIDNNVRMRAIGEELLVRKLRPDIFAYYYISKGIACPLMIQENVIAGYTAGAGEIGHTLAQPDGPICPTCGHAGCLDAVASETAILNFCREACKEGKAPVLRSLLSEEKADALDIKTVLRAQQMGDLSVCEIVEHAVEYLGISLANLINLISPGLVVVDGYLMKQECNRKKLRDVIAKHLYGLNEKEVGIEFLSFDLYRGAKGSAAKVLRKFLLE
ncbi:ROK family protein [Caproiciproducens sp. NJN-50]|uniref:ROK family protein n=2 Tax=Acutalibacteraceae TaxID=3082771 RepID=UPI000FFE1B5F|nr:ROK family protein [Caproiciproducens sp. NJN-50]QAT49115.1 ROK family protein [Caproiciproducens sp. NJN-50]